MLQYRPLLFQTKEVVIVTNISDRRHWVVDQSGKKVRVPGVSTIVGRFGNAGGLIHWAWENGYNGLTLDEARIKACTIGSTAHALVEAHAKGLDKPDISALPEEIKEGAEVSYANYLDWADRYKFEAIDSEIKLSSSDYLFGGRRDISGIVDGKRALIEIKTSNKLYEKDLLQAAAYCHLQKENNPDDPFEVVVMLRISKESTVFATVNHTVDSLAPAWDAFLNELANYRLEKKLSKLL